MLPHTVIRALCPRLQLHHRSVSRSLFEARGSGTPIVRGPGYEEDQLEVDLMDGHRAYLGSGYQMGEPPRQSQRADPFSVSNRVAKSRSSSCMCSTSSLFCVFGRYSFTEAELKHVFPGKVWAYRCSESTRIEASNRQAEQNSRSRAATLFSAAITA